jgi:hypothetical protein
VGLIRYASVIRPAGLRKRRSPAATPATLSGWARAEKTLPTRAPRRRRRWERRRPATQIWGDQSGACAGRPRSRRTGGDAASGTTGAAKTQSTYSGSAASERIASAPAGGGATSSCERAESLAKDGRPRGAYLHGGSGLGRVARTEARGFTPHATPVSSQPLDGADRDQRRAFSRRDEVRRQEQGVPTSAEWSPFVNKCHGPREAQSRSSHPVTGDRRSQEARRQLLSTLAA